ncbi:hypothetical protein [Nocardia brasiliensis]|uniref:Uncharacterized protein n=1 Tax=Nocardia brasiliensis (strain ATCC 700358 / HUJEG-1) TaxID=1133849 RepID=K0ESP7_NOCB7|nr:hypothetical protein [Nocardia brasiliensis]AFU02788.1 hypothetical protein O3I_024165 [Nocardia brasiliensis ATCC 700358]OCF85525.1 hypothetical protein AW168_35280 [Nocardia brasiliensis]
MADETEGLFTLPTLFDDGSIPVCWSYGMGVESTAGIVRTLLEPGFRPPQLRDDLSNLIVMVAQTGDEWTSTCDLVTAHVLPLLRERAIRFVEVARAGPSATDGIVVLQDSRRPQRLHPDADEHGFYALSAEHRANGVLPTLGGTRTCSAKSKGMPLDLWRAKHLGHGPYVHAMGFNADESRRIEKDSSVTMGGQRQPIYPLHEAGWSRARCHGYLFGLFGVWWPKSCCRQCCFVSVPGWPEQLERYIAAPAEAFKHLLDEYVTLALNRNSGLFGPGKSLADRLRRDGADHVLALAAAELDRCGWAVYRVRRCYSRPATAWRSVETIYRGSRAAASRFLTELGVHLGICPHDDGKHTRVWLTEASITFPRLEEFFVAAPDSVLPKQRAGFDKRWYSHADSRLAALELAAHDLYSSPDAA